MRYAGHAFVDWDDTIAENIRYFHMAEEANTHLIARLTGFEPDIVRKRGQELDLAVARRMGLVQASFGTAWAETYRELAKLRGQEPDPAAEEAIWEACGQPYKVRQELLPGAAETLTWLHAAGFEVTIWTAGEEAVQSRKIAESGLGHLVHRQQIVVDKTPERLQAAIGQRNPELCFVVGNSMHSDIRPALALGVMAVHVPADTWAYDHAHLDVTDANYRVIPQITDLPTVLSDRFRQVG